jgi:hypothetical protein
MKATAKAKTSNKGVAPKLVKGAKAETKKGFAQNIKREKMLGKSEKRAVGTAYGESYLGIDKMEKAAAKRKKK